jgi:hypothetical protein
LRRPRQLREHLRDPNREVARMCATLGRREPAQAQDIEDGGAFVNASESDNEMAAAFGRSAAARAFGDVEDDAQGGSFELIPENPLTFGWEKIHHSDVKLECELIDIQVLV